MTKKGAQYPDLLIQDAYHKKNFKCFMKAVKQVEGEYAEFCDKYENIIYMKLTDYSMQDVNVMAGTGLEIEKVVPDTLPHGNANSSMKVSRKISAVRHQRVGRELVRDYPMVDYETLWQVSFALENKVTHARQIWFVQDDEESRNKTRRLAAVQDSSSKN